ncbi:MAG: hypothetical protein QXW69_07295 [Nitrososphaerota archaeon]
MINFTKLSSLMIIILFFPSLININLNSNTYSQVSKISQAFLYPILKEDGLYAIAMISTRYNVTNIDWGNVNRNGNVFFVNIKIDFGEIAFSLFEPGAIELIHEYKIGDIDIGEYSLELYINDYNYGIIDFTINPSPIPYEELIKLAEIEGFYIEDFKFIGVDKGYYIKGKDFWNGKEWIFEVSLFLNFAPQKIDWGEARYIGKDYIKIGNYEITIYIREINITLNGKWLKLKEVPILYHYEHNYTLGLLPKGQQSIWVNINNYQDIGLGYNFDSEDYIITITKTINATTTYIITKNGETIIKTTTYKDIIEETIVSTITIFATYEEETFTEESETITTTSILEETPIETTSIIEEIETTMLETEKLETKTIQTFIETKKEEFKIEQFTIPISLFIIVIIITLLLYYILFKRREI